MKLEQSPGLPSVQAVSLGPTVDAIDRLVIAVTSAVLGVIGVIFIGLLCAAVVGRYLFDLPLAFIGESSRILLVWFFMLGIGLAFRKRAHVAVDVVTDRVPPNWRRRLALVANFLGILFVLHVAAGGILGLSAASRQIELTLGISGLWAASAVPCGALLLLYNQLRVLAEQVFGTEMRETAR